MFKLEFFDKRKKNPLKFKLQLILLMAAISNIAIPYTNANVAETSKNVHDESKNIFWNCFMVISSTNKMADNFQLPINDE